MKKLSPLTYAVAIPGRKKHAVLHANLLKQFHTPETQVHGIAVVEDDGLDSLPGMKLVREGNVLSDDDIKQIEVVLKEFPTVLTVTPGLTDVVTMNIDTGDRSVRLCVDYRGLNALTTADPYQMPLIKQVLNDLAEAVVLSKLDLNKGFHQVPIVVRDRFKTAFSSPWGKFHYNRMPFGVKSGPAILSLTRC